MAAIEEALQEQPLEKGLKSGALGLISSIVIGVASTAPAAACPGPKEPALGSALTGWGTCSLTADSP